MAAGLWLLTFAMQLGFGEGQGGSRVDLVMGWIDNSVKDVGGAIIQVRTAYQMAIADINNNSSLLEGYSIKGVDDPLMPSQDGATPYTPSKWLTETATEMGKDENVLAVLGSYFTSPTMDVDGIIKGYNKAHGGYWAGSPLLSDDMQFPYFARTNPSSKWQSEALVQFISYNSWDDVAVLSGFTKEAGAEYFIALCAARGISVSHTRITEWRNENETKAAVSHLKASSSNKYVLILENEELESVMLTAEDMDMTGNENIWLLQSDPEDVCVGKSCSKVVAALQGSIGVKWNGGYLFSKYQKDFVKYYEAIKPGLKGTLSPDDVSVAAAFMYDIVYGIALAADSLVRAGLDPTKGNKLHKALVGLTWEGATGQINFNHLGERTMPINLINQQTSKGTYVPIGEWVPDEEESGTKGEFDPLTPSGSLVNLKYNAIYWPDGSTDLVLTDAPTSAPDKCEADTNETDIKQPVEFKGYRLGSLVKNASLLGSYDAAIIRDSVADVNDSPTMVTQSELGLTEYSFIGVADMLPEVGDAVRASGTTAILGPQQEELLVQEVQPVMGASSTPHVDYTTWGFISGTLKGDRAFSTQMALSHRLQAEAMYAVVENFGWTEVVVITSVAQLSSLRAFQEVANDRLTIVDGISVVEGINIFNAMKACKYLNSTGMKIVLVFLQQWETFNTMYEQCYLQDMAGGAFHGTWITYSPPLYEAIRANENVVTDATVYSPLDLLNMKGVILLYPRLRITLEQSKVKKLRESNSTKLKNKQTGDLPKSLNDMPLLYMSDGSAGLVNTPFASSSVLNARDAVALNAMVLQNILKRKKDPTDGREVMETIRNNTFHYADTGPLILYYLGIREEATYNVTHVHSIKFNEEGERILPVDVYNVGPEGQLRLVGGVAPGKKLKVYGNFTFMGEGKDAETTPNDKRCMYDHYYDSDKPGCLWCGELVYPFNTTSWTCGPLKPVDTSDADRRIYMAVWTSTILLGIVAGFVLCYLVIAWVTAECCERQEHQIILTIDRKGDWKRTVVESVKAALCSEIAWSVIFMLLEFVDISLVWWAGFELHLQVPGMDYANIVVGYFTYLSVMSIVFIYYLTYRLGCFANLMEDYGQTREIWAKDHPQAKYDESKAILSVRGSVNVEKAKPGDLRNDLLALNAFDPEIMTDFDMGTHIFMLVMAFFENGVFVGFQLNYIINVLDFNFVALSPLSFAAIVSTFVVSIIVFGCRLSGGVAHVVVDKKLRAFIVILENVLLNDLYGTKTVYDAARELRRNSEVRVEKMRQRAIQRKRDSIGVESKENGGAGPGNDPSNSAEVEQKSVEQKSQSHRPSAAASPTSHRPSAAASPNSHRPSAAASPNSERGPPPAPRLSIVGRGRTPQGTPQKVGGPRPKSTSIQPSTPQPPSRPQGTPQPQPPSRPQGTPQPQPHAPAGPPQAPSRIDIQPPQMDRPVAPPQAPPRPNRFANPPARGQVSPMPAQPQPSASNTLSPNSLLYQKRSNGDYLGLGVKAQTPHPPATTPTSFGNAQRKNTELGSGTSFSYEGDTSGEGDFDEREFDT